MDFTGIGVLLIGIGFLILSIFLAIILSNIASILSGVNKTVGQLPKQLDQMFDETGKLLQNSNNTLSDVNEKLGTLTPLFHVVGDVGESTRRLSSALVDASKSVKSKTEDDHTEEQNKKVGGLFGSTALGYYLLRKGKEQKESKGWKTYA